MFVKIHPSETPGLEIFGTSRQQAVPRLETFGKRRLQEALGLKTFGEIPQQEQYITTHLTPARNSSTTFPQRF